MRRINSNGKLNQSNYENEGVRTFFKDKIPPRFWPVFRFFDKYIIYLMYCIYLFRRLRKEKRYPPLPLERQQSVFSFKSTGIANSFEFGELSELLRYLGIRYCEGQHSIYIYREADIEKINPILASFYPYPIGLKIVKGSELAPDQTPYYTSYQLAPGTTRVAMRAVGSMKEKAFISNILNLNGATPRVYDIVKLILGNQIFHAFVVQPIRGKVIHGEKGGRFIAKLKRILKEQGVEVLGHKEHCDFKPPDFRNNIVADTTGSYYVDVQNFVMLSDVYQKRMLNAFQEKNIKPKMGVRKRQVFRFAHSEAKNLLEKRLETYYSELNQFFDKYDIKMKNSTLMDTGCNWGVFIMYALNHGARWCVGFERGANIDLVRRSLYQKGFTRFDLLQWQETRINFGNSSPFDNYDIIHITQNFDEMKVIKILKQTVGQLLVYEGWPHENVQDIREKLEKQGVMIDIIGHGGLTFKKEESNPVILARLRCFR